MIPRKTLMVFNAIVMVGGSCTVIVACQVGAKIVKLLFNAGATICDLLWHIKKLKGPDTEGSIHLVSQENNMLLNPGMLLKDLAENG